jgi:tRNA(fMet)-specific endonuclease VapC
MSGYLLDTNIASHVIKGDIPAVRERLAVIPVESVAVSAVTEAELRYGVAKRGYPPGLTARVHEFLIRVDVLPPGRRRWRASMATCGLPARRQEFR